MRSQWRRASVVTRGKFSRDFRVGDGTILEDEIEAESEVDVKVDLEVEWEIECGGKREREDVGDDCKDGAGLSGR